MKKKVSIGMIILYGALSLLANLIASWVGLFIPRVIFSGLASASAAVINTVGVITVFPLTLVFAWGILYFIFFKGQFSNLYESSEDSNLWLKKTARLVFPGELLRFFVCLTTVGFSGSTGMFAAIPTYLFELTYLKWADRAYAVRQMGQFIFADYAAYAVCYLVYILIHLLGIFFICKTIWKHAKEEHDDLIRHETK